MHEGKNFLSGPIPTTPTALLCKLVRQLYSNEEIVQGIQEGERLASIKCESFIPSICSEFSL